ncbi:Hypothetical predicted protein, partial [Xyrichtys novacula]
NQNQEQPTGALLAEPRRMYPLWLTLNLDCSARGEEDSNRRSISHIVGPSQWDSGCGPERSRQEKSYGLVSQRATRWSLSPAENTWRQREQKFYILLLSSCWQSL